MTTGAQRQRDDQTRDVRAVDVLLIRAALLAGATPAQAVGCLPAATTPTPLRALARSLDAGTTLESLAGASAVGHAGLGPIVRALATAEGSGASAAPALDGLLDAVTAGAALDRLVRSRSAEAKLTARFLVAIPLVTAAAISLLDPGARRFLATPPGAVVVVVAGVLIGLAAWWIRHLVGRVDRAVGATDPLAGSANLPTAECLDLLAVGLSGGLPLAGAVALVGRVGPPATRQVWADAGRALAAGLPPAEALPDRLAELADVIAIGTRWGSPSAASVRLLSRDLRDRAASAADEAAERLSVHLVFPTTLLLVPAFGLLVVVPMLASAFSGLAIGP